MNIEKLGLLFLINYFNQLGEVKKHLMSALKEVLLAVHTSVDIVGQSTGKSLLGNQLDFINPIIKQIQGLLEFSIDKVTPVDPNKQEMAIEESLKLKQHIVNSIISAIDDEIVSVRGTSTEKGKLKVEALQTVKQVLTSQKNKPVSVFEVREKESRRAAS